VIDMPYGGYRKRYGGGRSYGGGGKAVYNRATAKAFAAGARKGERKGRRY